MRKKIYQCIPMITLLIIAGSMNAQWTQTGSSFPQKTGCYGTLDEVTCITGITNTTSVTNLFAGTSEKGVYRYTSGSWVSVNNPGTSGLPTIPSNASGAANCGGGVDLNKYPKIQAMVAEGNKVFVAMNFYGVYYTNDGTVTTPTWTQLTQPYFSGGSVNSCSGCLVTGAVIGYDNNSDCMSTSTTLQKYFGKRCTAYQGNYFFSDMTVVGTGSSKILVVGVTKVINDESGSSTVQSFHSSLWKIPFTSITNTSWVDLVDLKVSGSWVNCTINSVVKYDNDNIVVGTDNGYFKYTISTTTLQNFAVKDGASPLECLQMQKNTNGITCIDKMVLVGQNGDAVNLYSFALPVSGDATANVEDNLGGRNDANAKAIVTSSPDLLVWSYDDGVVPTMKKEDMTSSCTVTSITPSIPATLTYYGSQYQATCFYTYKSAIYLGSRTDGVWNNTVSSLKEGEETESNGSFQLYPNPATNSLNIDYSKSEDGNVRLVLFDLDGREISSFNYTSGKSGVNFHTEIDISQLSAGIYFVRFEAGNVIICKKFVVMK